MGPTTDACSPASQRWAILAITAAWVVPIALDSAGIRVDLEEWLHSCFPPKFNDAYAHVNRLARPPFTSVALTWMCLAVVYSGTRRTNEMIALLVGPAITTTFLVFAVDYSDPAWFSIGAVTWVGCTVSIIASAIVRWLCPTPRKNTTATTITS
jgi:hypothetical protein